jgi:hypothetical protein
MEQVLCEIPMEFGYAAIGAAMSHDGWLQFSGVKIGGYIKSEIEKLAKENKQ